MLDTQYRVATPEGVEITLKPAGPVPRALAQVIDLVCRFMVYGAVVGSLGAMGRFGTGVMLLCAFVLEWILPAALEVMWQGATPGKRVVGLRVLHDDGTPVGWTAALVRNIMRAADFLPLFYGFGLLTMLKAAHFKRIGDIAAGTVVVHVQAPRARHVPADVPSLLPPLPLQLSEQRTLLDFAERVPGLTASRCEELAAQVPALTQSASGPEAVRRLLGYANHLMGR